MRVSYKKKMRERAKSEGKGLITIDIIDVNGSRSTVQIPAGEKELNYAYRALNHILNLVYKQHEGEES